MYLQLDFFPPLPSPRPRPPSSVTWTSAEPPKLVFLPPHLPSYILCTSSTPGSISYHPYRQNPPRASYHPENTWPNSHGLLASSAALSPATPLLGNWAPAVPSASPGKRFCLSLCFNLPWSSVWLSLGAQSRFLPPYQCGLPWQLFLNYKSKLSNYPYPDFFLHSTFCHLTLACIFVA